MSSNYPMDDIKQSYPTATVAPQQNQQPTQSYPTATLAPQQNQQPTSDTSDEKCAICLMILGFIVPFIGLFQFVLGFILPFIGLINVYLHYKSPNPKTRKYATVSLYVFIEFIFVAALNLASSALYIE